MVTFVYKRHAPYDKIVNFIKSTHQIQSTCFNYTIFGCIGINTADTLHKLKVKALIQHLRVLGVRKDSQDTHLILIVLVHFKRKF